MSEEINVVLSTENDENLENEIMKDNYSKPALHSNESPSTENAEIPAEKVQVQENQQPIESTQPEQNRSVHGSLKSNEESADSNPSEQRLSTFDASTETKFLGSTADGNQFAVSTTSDGSNGTISSKSASGNEPSVKSTASDGSTDTKSLERASGNEPSVKSTISDGSTGTISSKSPSGNESSLKSTASDGSTDTKSLERASGNEPSVKSTASDGSTDTKSLERASGNEPSVKSTASDGSTDTKSLERASGNETSLKSTPSDGSTNTKSLERSNDADQPAAKSTSTEISQSEVPSSDKGLEEVTENIQLIYEGLKGMKISTEEIPVSASGKKGRKPPNTPRARSTPVLTSPPLTRSRSRDLRKVPSTPSSPKRLAGRNTSEGDSDEMKVRGRQRAKKN